MSNQVDPYTNKNVSKVIEKLIQSPNYLHRDGSRAMFKPVYMPEGGYTLIESVTFFVPHFGQNNPKMMQSEPKGFIAIVNKMHYLGEDSNFYPVELGWTQK